MLTSIEQGIKFRKVNAAVLVVLYHNPDCNFSLCGWQGVVTAETHLDDLITDVLEKVSSVDLQNEEFDQFFQREPSLMSFIDTACTCLDLFPVAPAVAIVLTCGMITGGLVTHIGTCHNLSRIYTPDMSQLNPNWWPSCRNLSQIYPNLHPGHVTT